MSVLRFGGGRRGLVVLHRTRGRALVAFLVAAALVLAVGAPAAVARHASARPKLTDVPSRLKAGSHAVLVVQAAPGTVCRAVLRAGRAQRASAATPVPQGVLEFVWTVPARAGRGHYGFTVSCARTRRALARRAKSARASIAVTGRTHGSSPVPRHLGVVPLGDRIPAVEGYGAGQAPWGAVLIPGSQWFGGHGVDVHANTGCTLGCRAAYYDRYGLTWQCVELIERFVVSMGWSGEIPGNANQLYGNASDADFDKHPAGSGYTPVPGDILVYNGPSYYNRSTGRYERYGHVMIVSSVSGNSIQTVEQNASSTGWDSVSIDGNTIDAPRGWVGYPLIGILHAKRNGTRNSSSPPPPSAPSNAAMGGSSGSGIPLGVNLDGRLQTFLVGEDSQLYTTYQTAPSGSWSPFYSHGGSWSGSDSIGMGVNADGRLEVFLIGRDGRLYTSYQTQVNGGWSGWVSLGGQWNANDFVGVGRDADGDIQLFLVGQDTHLYTAYQTQPNGGFSGWVSLGGAWPGNDTIGVAPDADGRLNVFLVGQNSQLYTSEERFVNGPFGGWVSLGGQWPSDDWVATGLNADGRLAVFLVGLDKRLYQSVESSANGPFGGWTSLGGSWPNADMIGVGTNLDGRLQAFLVGDDAQLYTSYQTAAGGAWSAWYSHGGSWRDTDSIGIGRNADGRLQAFLVGDDAQLYTSYQTQVNGNWSSWYSHGGAWPARAAR